MSRPLRTLTAVAWLGALACDPTLTKAPRAGAPEGAGAAFGFLAPDGLTGVADQDALAGAKNVYRADPIPIDVCLVVDSSIAMALPLAGGSMTKWMAVQEA